MDSKSLWGVLSGLAVPRLAVDLPGGGGKVELVPNSQIETNQQSQTFQGWDGITAAYIDPDESNIQPPCDIKPYLKEWQELTQQVYGNNSAKIDNLDK